MKALLKKIGDWLLGVVLGFSVTVTAVPCKDCKTGVKPEVKVEKKVGDA